MPIYREHIYPQLVHRLGDPPPIRKVRSQLIPLAHGVVLEIGVGSGANFIHYDPTRVRKLYALEPNPTMIQLAERRRQQISVNVEFLDLPGERIPLEEGTLDTVVSTFTLCTIPGIQEAIQVLGSLLRPSGKLIFIELGLSPDTSVQRWQRRLEPLSRWIFQGLSLTRDIPALIEQGPFEIDQMEAGYMAEFPKPVTYCWWGTAKPALNEGTRPR